MNRVADRLNYQCGCKTNMACRMDPYPCRTCWENKKRVLEMEQAGMSDYAILDVFTSKIEPTKNTADDDHLPALAQRSLPSGWVISSGRTHESN